MIAGLLGEVAAVGAPAAAIDTVVLSHVDGIGWSTRPTERPTFPNARYLLPAELSCCRSSRSTIPAPMPVNSI